MSNHSPGPWTWDDEEDWAGDSLKSATGEGLGFYDEGPNARNGSPENRANRALIAAAPELLETLRYFVDMAVTNPMHPRVAKALALLDRLDKASE